jgi:hypothetical protein
MPWVEAGPYARTAPEAVNVTDAPGRLFLGPRQISFNPVSFINPLIPIRPVGFPGFPVLFLLIVVLVRRAGLERFSVIGKLSSVGFPP